MPEVGLQYHGKKTKFVFKNDFLGVEIRFPQKETVWVDSNVAKILMEGGPGAFHSVGERGVDIEPVEDAADMIAADKSEAEDGDWPNLEPDLEEEIEDTNGEASCEICGKVCKNKSGLRLHKMKAHPDAD